MWSVSVLQRVESLALAATGEIGTFFAEKDALGLSNCAEALVPVLDFGILVFLV